MAFITTIMDKIYYKDPKIYKAESLSEEYLNIDGKSWWCSLLRVNRVNKFYLKTLCWLLLEGALQSASEK